MVYFLSLFDLIDTLTILFFHIILHIFFNTSNQIARLRKPETDDLANLSILVLKTYLLLARGIAFLFFKKHFVGEFVQPF